MDTSVGLSQASRDFDWVSLLIGVAVVVVVCGVLFALYVVFIGRLDPNRNWWWIATLVTLSFLVVGALFFAMTGAAGPAIGLATCIAIGVLAAASTD